MHLDGVDLVKSAIWFRVLRDTSQYPLSGPNGSKLLTFDWVLVLPPWSQTFHWKHQNASASLPQPWSKFFDLESLRLFIQVIEFEDFLQIGAFSVINNLV